MGQDYGLGADNCRTIDPFVMSVLFARIRLLLIMSNHYRCSRSKSVALPVGGYQVLRNGKSLKRDSTPQRNMGLV